MSYKSGDHYVICDVCGFRFYESETRKRWDGLRVCHADWEPRHPQDMVRARRDRQRVANPRPEAPDVFLEPNDVTPDDLDPMVVFFVLRNRSRIVLRNASRLMKRQ